MENDPSVSGRPDTNAHACGTLHSVGWAGGGGTDMWRNIPLGIGRLIYRSVGLILTAT